MQAVILCDLEIERMNVMGAIINVHVCIHMLNACKLI